MYDTETDPIEVEGVSVIHNSNFILKKCIEILKSANDEIELVYNNTNNVFYQSEMFETLRFLKKKIKIKVLMQKESNKSINSETDNEFSIGFRANFLHCGININQQCSSSSIYFYIFRYRYISGDNHAARYSVNQRL